VLQWNLDSFRNGIEELLKKKREGTVKAIKTLDVLIIEVSIISPKSGSRG
jgi:predicted nucleic acid-binding protein